MQISSKIQSYTKECGSGDLEGRSTSLDLLDQAMLIFSHNAPMFAVAVNDQEADLPCIARQPCPTTSSGTSALCAHRDL